MTTATKPSNIFLGVDLNELRDLQIDSPVSGSSLYFDQADSKWKNSTDLTWDETNNRLNVNGGIFITDESKVTNTFSLTSNMSPDAGSTKLKFGYEGISGIDKIATSVVVEFNQTTGPDSLTEGGLIVKNTEETEVTSNYSQLTSKKLSIGGKAEDTAGAGGTTAATLEVDLSDEPSFDDGGVGATISSGGAKFDIQYGANGSGIVIHKSYRFKGDNNRDVILSNGSVKLFETGGTNYTTIESQSSLASNVTLLLPSESGTIATVENIDSAITKRQVTIAASGLTTLDSVDTTGGTNTVKYIVQIKSGTSFQSQEILMVHNGTNVYMSESNVIVTSGTLATFDANLSGSTMNLTLTLNQTNNVVRLTRIVV